jgi:hypothetical protein
MPVSAAQSLQPCLLGSEFSQVLQKSRSRYFRRQLCYLFIVIQLNHDFTATALQLHCTYDANTALDDNYDVIETPTATATS